MKREKNYFCGTVSMAMNGAMSGDGYNNQSVTCVQQCEARFFFSETLRPPTILIFLTLP